MLYMICIRMLSVHGGIGIYAIVLNLGRKGKELLLWGIDGMIMEIPQRLMMQSFVYELLKLLGVLSLELVIYINKQVLLLSQ